MRRFDKALQSVNSRHRQESYSGPLASTSAGGHNANMNNLYNSQVRNAKTVMPYGISSRPNSGVKAQAIVNDDSESVIVGVYDQNRPKVGVGETCIYSSGGCSIYLSSNGKLSIKSGGSNIAIDKNTINIYKGETNITIGDNGDISINTSGSVGIESANDIAIKSGGTVGIEAEAISLSSDGNIDMNCNNFIVNGETMIVP